MSRRAVGWLLALACAAGACGPARNGSPRRGRRCGAPPPAPQADAEALGREVFDLVDRAVDYRGSHRGRPAATLRQMGVESLTPTTARVLVNVEREPVVTVAFRRPDSREIVSCRGDSQILEEASVNGGRFTLMCTTSAGAQRPIQVGDLRALILPPHDRRGARHRGPLRRRGGPGLRRGRGAHPLGRAQPHASTRSAPGPGSSGGSAIRCSCRWSAGSSGSAAAPRTRRSGCWAA